MQHHIGPFAHQRSRPKTPNALLPLTGVFSPYAAANLSPSNAQCRCSVLFAFSYTTYVCAKRVSEIFHTITPGKPSVLTIDTAGTTFNKFGVNPLNNPFTPSYFSVCFVTSTIPVYVLGWPTVP